MAKQQLEAVVNIFHAHFESQGWSTINEKPLQNGLQFTVTDGTAKVSVNCFTNGNALIQGPPSALQANLQDWWKAQKTQSTPPMLQEPNVRPKVQKAIEAFRSFALDQGWTLAGKQIHNGIYQLRLTQEKVTIPVDFYPTGTVLIQGNPGGMRTTMEDWWKQHTQPQTPTLWEPEA